eukprot:s441_g22.t1
MGFLADKHVLSLPAGPIGMTPLTPASSSMQSSQELDTQMEPSLFDAHCTKLFCKLPKIEWDVRLDSQRNAALAKWHKIVTSEPLAFEVCRSYFNSVKAGLHCGKLQDDLKNVFASKSTSTLSGRAGPIMRYMYYCDNMQHRAFPVSEEVVYSFMLAEEPQAAPTFFKSFLSSLAFSWHVIGLTGADIVVQSKRIKGLADKCYLLKQKTRSRLPLRVDELTTPEEIVLGRKGRALPDRHAAGCFLFMTYARARYSDMMNVGLLQFEDAGNDDRKGYIEAQVARSKTSFSVDRKVRLLPMTATMYGVVHDSWGLAWKEVIEQAGITVAQGKPLLPGRTPEGWHTLPLTAEAATNWLRNMLQSGEFFNDNRLHSVGTHSCKATTLSWMAKWGTSVDTRRLMGYHVADRMSTMLIYGRDNTSSGLRELDEILKWIMSGDFVPDAGRAGMFPHAEDDKPWLEKQDQNAFDGHYSDSSSEDSADEDEPNHASNEQAENAVFGRWDGLVDVDKLPKEAVYFRHPLSRTIHLVEDEAGIKFACGRDLNKNYLALPSRPQTLLPICKQCFNKFKKI